MHKTVLNQFFLTNALNILSLTLPFEIFEWIGTNYKKVDIHIRIMTTRLKSVYRFVNKLLYKQKYQVVQASMVLLWH